MKQLITQQQQQLTTLGFENQELKIRHEYDLQDNKK